MDLSFPIGRYAPKPALTPQDRLESIGQIERTPALLRAAVSGLDPGQLATPYRPGGWTVAQVVHHLADNDMNVFLRFKRALTETDPPIRRYDQVRWADLPDAAAAPVESSLDLLEALHRRWVSLLRAMSAEDFARAVIHPERGRVTLEHLLGLYAWHGLHHVAQITSLRERMGWR